MPIIVVGIEDGGIWASHIDGGRIVKRTRVHDAKDYAALPAPVYCSSSMDFPEDFTDDKKLVRLARRLRKSPWR